MSVRKLADQAGISNPYLSQIERGLRKPSAEILMSIARALDIRTESLYERAGEVLHTALHPHHPFSGFGLVCVGPIDGHDIVGLIDMFEHVKDLDRPVLVHCKTVKGKGYEFSTGDPTTWTWDFGDSGTSTDQNP